MICTILKNKDKIKETDASKGVTRIFTQRLRILDDVERLLLIWINEKQLQGDSINVNIICEKKNEVSVLGVSEVRWKGQGEIRSGDYTVYYSRGEGAGTGVAIVVHKSVVRSVVKKIDCNDRIIALKSKAEPADILIMRVYMPTSEYEDEVEKVYDTIEEILQEDGRRDTNSIILGDWNSIVGDEPYQNIVGSHGLGRRNHRGQMLIDFCE
ncbi:hypothetical protein B7P43_G17273 [Cryptotermes secundus]|uniref:Endonuclease/exonuclease/phosphatase domain-containing protein n=1 Tax=Cryptotermes secundus TaxID=105785 RepID=A0A2J7R089_9NEOP|nr:hypothetical protein B7P43_G17273 [Cryptotermes secundus]